MVASLSCVWVKCSSMRTSIPNGAHTPRRTTLSANAGVRLLLGSSPSSASRGKNPPAAGGTDGRAALQHDRLVVRGGQRALLLPRQLHCCPTVRTHLALGRW